MTKNNLQNKEIRIEYVSIDLLKPVEYNPRKWDREAENNLKESIKRYGVVDPLLVNAAENRKNIVIGGHFRLSVMKELEIKTVPVVYINIPNIEKEKELVAKLKASAEEQQRLLDLINIEKSKGINISPVIYIIAIILIVGIGVVWIIKRLW